MITSSNRAIYNERRRSLARRGISIPDAFCTDAEASRDPREWFADGDAEVSERERADTFDGDTPLLLGPR
jgi:hypothetical protein